MKKFFKNFKPLRKFDIFGYPVTLTMKENHQYKTIFGGVLALIFKFFFLTIILVSLSGLFSNKNLFISVSQTNLGTNYGAIDLSQNTLNFALRFQNSILNNWTNPYFNITVYHVTQFRNITTVLKLKQVVPMKLCEKRDFGELENEFMQLQLEDALCPDKDANLTLQGNFQESVYSYFQISIDSCSDLSICQSQSKIQNVSLSIGKIRVEFFIANNMVDLHNIENPLSQHLVSDMHFLIDPSKKFYKTADIFLSEMILQLEKGYFPSILPSIKVIKSFFFNQDVREQVAIYDPDAINIADFYYRKGPVSYQYYRDFGDFVRELSGFAGIWSTGYVWLMIFISSYNKNFFINSLSNKLYNFPSQMKKKTNNPPKTTQSKDYQENFVHESPEIKGFTQKLFEKIEVYLSYDKKNNISFWEMWKFPIKLIFSCLGCKFTEKEKLLLESQANLIRDLDICNILKKLQEIEKIKDLLFTPEQQTLLSFTPKPEIISTNKELKRNETLKNISRTMREKKERGRFLANEVQFNSIKPFEELILAWKLVKNSENQPWTINENLLKMFGEDIPRIIDLMDADIHNVKRRNAQQIQQNFHLILTSKRRKKGSNINLGTQIESPLKKDRNNEIDDKEKVIEMRKKENTNNEINKYESIKQEIRILEEKQPFSPDVNNNTNNNNNEIFTNTKLYENLIEMNQNILKICNFDINDKNDSEI